MTALHEINTRCGYLPAAEVRRAANDLGVPLSVIYSAATFYALFSFKPCGKHKLQVCEGTACYVKGAAALLAELQKDLGIQVDQTTAICSSPSSACAASARAASPRWCAWMKRRLGD